MARIIVTPSDALRSAADRLRQVDRKLPGQMRKMIRRAATKLVRAQKSAVRSAPVKGKAGSTGLRRKVAGSVKFILRTGGGRSGAGAAAFVHSRMSGRLRFAPGGLESERTAWAAPLFGNRRRWYRHQGQSSWFYGPTKTIGNEVRQEVNQIINMTAQEIRRALS